ncbi:uncharacterized protein LOC108950520 isoform X2 [Ciona intestinalis]
MKVGLAKDTLSWKVGKCLTTIKGAKGTADYVLLFLKWFDIVNCRFNHPIRSINDDRMIWLKQHFIVYLLEWQRQLGRRSQNPDVSEAAYGVQHILQRKIIIKKLKGVTQQVDLKIPGRTCVMNLFPRKRDHDVDNGNQ